MKVKRRIQHGSLKKEKEEFKCKINACHTPPNIFAEAAFVEDMGIEASENLPKTRGVLRACPPPPPPPPLPSVNYNINVQIYTIWRYPRLK